MAVSGWARTQSQSCTTRGSSSIHRMLCDSQSPWPIHTRPRVEVSRSLTLRAASSIHSGPVTRLRSCPCSSRSGHGRGPGWSHAVHAGDGVRSGTLAGVGADLMRSARSAANGAAPSSGGRGLPPGTADSAVTIRSRTRVAIVSGYGHGKPDRASSACTRRQPAIRGWKGRALITTCRPLDNSTPTTSETCPERKSTRLSGASMYRRHQSARSAFSSTPGSIAELSDRRAWTREAGHPTVHGRERFTGWTRRTPLEVVQASGSRQSRPDARPELLHVSRQEPQSALAANQRRQAAC
jgi:hypothetical protein